MSNVHHLHAPMPMPAADAAPQLWAIASGKGGVGKSFVTTSLATLLAWQGKRVVLVDLDLGCANLHTWLGMAQPASDLSQFLGQRERGLNDFAIPTNTEGLRIISGANSDVKIANISYSQKQRIIRHLRLLDADYVLLDLGAGTAFNTLDFFIHADKGIMTIIPEPTSIENFYRFLKSLSARKINTASTEALHIMKQVLARPKTQDQAVRTLNDCITHMESSHPEHAQTMRDLLAELKLELIVNQTQEPSDNHIGSSIQIACQRFFSLPIRYLGYLPFDRMVSNALRNQQVFVNEYPHARLTIHARKILNSLTTKHHNTSMRE